MTDEDFTGTGFLKGLTGAQVRDGIAALPEHRFNQMVKAAFPGKPTKAASVAEALVEAGANFQVARAPYFFPSQDGESAIESTRAAAIVRTDSGAEIGHATPDGYGLVQTLDATAGAQALIEQGKMALNSVDVVDGGSKVRVSGIVGASVIEQLGRENADGPDVLAHFAQFTADHSGAGSTVASLATIRLVCFNGMTTKEHAAAFKIRHTTKAADRVAEATAALLQINRQALEETTILQKLAMHRMTKADFRVFAIDLIDEVRGALTEDSSNRKRLAQERAIAELELSFGNGEGNFGKSSYDGYNAVTDWLTPRRESFKDAVRFAKKWESSAHGHGAAIKSLALRKLKKLARVS